MSSIPCSAPLRASEGAAFGTPSPCTAVASSVAFRRGAACIAGIVGFVLLAIFCAGASGLRGAASLRVQQGSVLSHSILHKVLCVAVDANNHVAKASHDPHIMLLLKHPLS